MSRTSLVHPSPNEQLYCVGEVLLYGIEPSERLEISHISCNANSNSPTGVKKVPEAGEYSLKMAKKIGQTNLYSMASGLDRFMESNPLQLHFKMFQDIQRQIPPPRLLSRMYPAGSPKISLWVVTLVLVELVRECLGHHRVSSYKEILSYSPRMHTKYSPR